MKPMKLELIWAGIIAVVALVSVGSISVGIVSAFDFGWSGAVDGRRGRRVRAAPTLLGYRAKFLTVAWRSVLLPTRCFTSTTSFG